VRDHGPVQVHVKGVDLPGRRFGDERYSGCVYDDIMVGVQRGRDIEQLAPADAAEVRFDFELRPCGDRDARGPYAHGRPNQRFVYLCWVAGPDREMFRRAKLMLADIPAEVWVAAQAPDRRLEGTLGLTDGRGGPLCARVPSAAIGWSAVPTSAGEQPRRS